LYTIKNDESYNPISIIEELKYFFQNGYTNGTHLTSKSLNKKCKNHIYVKPKKNKEETTYILCKYVK